MTRDTVPVDVDAVLFWKAIALNALSWQPAQRSSNLVNKLRLSKFRQLCWRAAA
jgi:hypothetical protein